MVQRYDPAMTRYRRRSSNDGICIYQDYAKALDSNDFEFAVQKMGGWKQRAQPDLFHQVMRHGKRSANFRKRSSDKELSCLLVQATGLVIKATRSAEPPRLLLLVRQSTFLRAEA